jgi:hypothetical protein
MADPDRLCDMSGCRVSRTSVVGEHEITLVDQAPRNHGNSSLSREKHYGCGDAFVYNS